MKKITKILLPMASVAVVTAPVLTLVSCGTSESFTYYKDSEYTAYQGKYKTEQPSEPMALDVGKAFYFDAIAKDKSIFTHDMLYHFNQSEHFIVSDEPDIFLNEKVSITLNSVDTTNFLLSLSFTYDNSNEVPEENLAMIEHMDCTITNFPYDVTYKAPGNGLEYGWYLKPLIKPLATADYNWSVKGTTKYIIKSPTTSSESVFKCDMNKKNFSDGIEECLPPAFYSEFMKNVALSE